MFPMHAAAGFGHKDQGDGTLWVFEGIYCCVLNLFMHDPKIGFIDTQRHLNLANMSASRLAVSIV